MAPTGPETSSDPAQPQIHGQGTPDADWLACPALRAVPPRLLDAWLPAAARLVVVAPHPDDEVLACGGLLAAHAARGGQVLVLAVTDGEASHGGCLEWPAATLRPARRDESAAGLARLAGPGGSPPRRLGLGLPDGGVAAQVDVLRAWLLQQLQAGDVVVTTWQHDGHPDHEASASAAITACGETGCPLLQAPVWMWHWAHCADARLPWPQLRSFVLPAAAWQRKQHALAAHATQLQPRSNGAGPVLGAHIVQRAARRAEYFFV